MNLYAWFLTLTYADPHRPFALCKEHFQKYLKRLRSRHPSASVRYSCRLEFGGNTQREHGHIIIFSNTNLFPRFGISHDDCWPHGALLIAPLTRARMRYVAAYTQHSYGKTQTAWMCSLKPPIGAPAIRLLARNAARAQGTQPLPIPTALWLGAVLYPISRVLKEHFKDEFEKNGGIVAPASSWRMWRDQPTRILETILDWHEVRQKRTLADLLLDRQMARERYERETGS